ncbi:MAG: hypothetical protein K8J31_19810 [Anaerolineae bacterium]|nr:hypothetical protein [Anaerolineae bacterium]
MKRTLAILLCLCVTLGLERQVLQAEDSEPIRLRPAWSPDGELVSYLASDGIHLMSKEGDHDRLLAPPSGFGGWTADSTGVFIIENRNPGEAALEWWIYPVDGTDAFQFLPQLRSIHALEYSHDGEQVAVSAQANESDPSMIWVARADGSQLRPLAEYQVYDLSWSSDDTQIILETVLEDAGNRQMVEVSIDISGGREPQIRPFVNGIRSVGGGIDFSYVPDSSYPPATFYITDILDHQESVFTVNQWVADIDYAETSRRVIYTAYCDSTGIDEAFLQGEWSAAQQETIETALYLIDLTTSEQRVLIPCGSGSQMATSWSPDGQEILFVWINDHRWDVYRVYADEPRFVNLTEE